jgi:hypothetical protein
MMFAITIPDAVKKPIVRGGVCSPLAGRGAGFGIFTVIKKGNVQRPTPNVQHRMKAQFAN